MLTSKNKQECSKCKSSDSPKWRKDQTDLLCQACYTRQDTNTETENSNQTETSDTSNGGNGGNHHTAAHGSSRRASMRIKSAKQKTSERRLPTKGHSKRITFKQKAPLKGTSVAPAVTVSDFVFYQGQYFQTGDIIHVIDEDDGCKYYAQCRSFLTNIFCQKSVVLTWLLPLRTLEEDESFQPHLFYLGPEEDFARNIDYVTFVCHAPSDYYVIPKSPFPVIPFAKKRNYVSSSIMDL